MNIEFVSLNTDSTQITRLKNKPMFTLTQLHRNVRVTLCICGEFEEILIRQLGINMFSEMTFNYIMPVYGVMQS